MAKRHQYYGCDIRIGEHGTTIHGRNLRHAISNLDEHIREKYQMPLNEYLVSGNNGKTGKKPNGGNGGATVRSLLPLRHRDQFDFTVNRTIRRRRA